jgi:hypothetical protein
MRKTLAFLPAGALLGVLPLAAQEYEPATLGAQVRVSVPEGDLKSAVGGVAKPGLGASVEWEEDFLDGIRGRVGLGIDNWFKGDWEDRPGMKGGLSATHLTVTVVRMLRPDADPPLTGPYVLGGVGLTAWSLTSEDSLAGTKVTRKATHMSFVLGAGWRIARGMDVEFKVLTGKVEPDFTATAVMGGVTFRF